MRRKARSVGSRQAAWLLDPEKAALFRDPARDQIPVVSLPEWLAEPGSDQRTETPMPETTLGTVTGQAPDADVTGQQLVPDTDVARSR